MKQRAKLLEVIAKRIVEAYFAEFQSSVLPLFVLQKSIRPYKEMLKASLLLTKKSPLNPKIN